MKPYITTSKAAKLVGVSTNTISRCFDKGELKGFLIPFSLHRRICIKSLAAMCLKYGIPLPESLKQFTPGEPLPGAAPLPVEENFS